jgi:hypothetical protein
MERSRGTRRRKSRGWLGRNEPADLQLDADNYMITAEKDGSLPSRLAACGILQAVFFLWIYPHLGRWIRRDTNVYFCFAAFALALMSVTVVVPILFRTSPVAKVFVRVMALLAIWELLTATRVLFYYI